MDPTTTFALLAVIGLAIVGGLALWLVESRVKPVREHRDRLQRRVIELSRDLDQELNAYHVATSDHVDRLARIAEARRLVSIGRADLADELMRSLDRELRLDDPDPPGPSGKTPGGGEAAPGLGDNGADTLRDTRPPS